jgi:hypothetical protein
MFILNEYDGVLHNKYWLKCSSIENYLQYSLAALTPPPNYFWRAEEESGIMHYSSLFFQLLWRQKIDTSMKLLYFIYVIIHNLK